MELYHFAQQTSPRHCYGRRVMTLLLNSPSKQVRPPYLFALIDGRGAAFAGSRSDSPLSDPLPLLPSVPPRELTLIPLDRNVFSANVAFEYSSGECVETTPLAVTEMNPAAGGPPIRRSPADTQTHTQDNVWFCLSYFCFIFCGCWVATSVRWLTCWEFCVLFVDLHCGDLEKETVRNYQDAWLHNSRFSLCCSKNGVLIIKFMVFTYHRPWM